MLADEINRAPAKVQSALLEAMDERQVSVGRTTYPLPALFLVMATQNPIEQEGTYPLPEAQLDRFLLHVRVGYPAPQAEREILRLARREARPRRRPPAPPAVSQRGRVRRARARSLALHMAEQRRGVHRPARAGDARPALRALRRWLDYGVSPRGTIALDRAARAHAWLKGRDFVAPDDVQAVVHDALRHRLILNFDAEAAGTSPDQVIDELLTAVPVG